MIIVQIRWKFEKNPLFCLLPLHVYVFFSLAVFVLMINDRSLVIDSSSLTVIMLFRFSLIGNAFYVVWTSGKEVHAKLDGSLYVMKFLSFVQ